MLQGKGAGHDFSAVMVHHDGATALQVNVRDAVAVAVNQKPPQRVGGEAGAEGVVL
ncbi:hypothetical protein D3C80_1302730 [compost metagenome]